MQFKKKERLQCQRTENRHILALTNQPSVGIENGKDFGMFFVLLILGDKSLLTSHVFLQSRNTLNSDVKKGHCCSNA